MQDLYVRVVIFSARYGEAKQSKKYRSVIVLATITLSTFFKFVVHFGIPLNDAHVRTRI